VRVEAISSRLAIDKARGRDPRGDLLCGHEVRYVDGYPHREEVVRYLIAAVVVLPRRRST